MRILVYCQHVLGIGHLVRTFEILKALKEHQITLLLGGAEITLAPPGNVTIVQLPPLMMDSTFSTLSTPTGKPLEEIKKQRQKIISGCLREVQPDILLIELYPFGRNGFHFEIEPLLKQAKLETPSCLIASSVRDILVERDNRLKFERRAVERLNLFFDLLLIHSDPAVIRLNETFSRIADLKIQTVYTGYVHRQPKLNDRVQKKQEDPPLIIASAGGGSVGYALLKATLKAHTLLTSQYPCILHLYTGPYLEQEKQKELSRLAGNHARIATFCDDLPAALRQAALSVSMGGYNTTMDVVVAGCPALIYPFNQNHEQRLRAERLRHYVPITVLEAKDLLPSVLAQHMYKALYKPSAPSQQIAMDGAKKTAQTLTAMAQKKIEVL